MITSPADRKKIKDALQEISDSMTRIDGERSLIAQIKADLHEDFKQQLTKKQISKMARVYHKQTFTQEQRDADEFETLYQEVVLLSNGDEVVKD
jgi:hypothetical protein